MSVTGASVKVEGDVTEASHAKWVQLKSFEFDINREVRSVTGRAMDRNTESPNISPVKCKKPVDMASYTIFQNVLFGAAATSVKIDFTREEDNGESVVWQSFSLYDVIFFDYSYSADDQEHPTEEFKMSHTKFTQTYFPTGADGKLGNGSTAGFDQKLCKKV